MPSRKTRLSWVVLITLVLIVDLGSSQPCHSTCQDQLGTTAFCSSPQSISACSACPAGYLTLDPTPTNICIGLTLSSTSPATQVLIVKASSSASTILLASTTTSFTFSGIPLNAFKLQIRVAGLLQIGCIIGDSILNLTTSADSVNYSLPLINSDPPFTSAIALINVGNGKNASSILTLTFLYNSSTCTSVQIFDISAVAYLCDPSCASCNPTANDCVCASSKYLLNGACISNCDTKKNDQTTSSCVDNCPTNTYLEGNNCKACNVGCNGCIGPANTECSSCDAAYKSHSGACVASCPSTTYTSGSNCIDCDASCFGCTTNSTNCAACASSYLRVVSTNECSASCPSTTYQSAATCIDCDATCNGCTVSPTHCTACAADKKNDTTTATCVAACPAGTYEAAAVCYSCDASCNGCTSSATNCDACQSTHPLRDTASNRCVAACSTGTYQASSNCEPCDSSCYTCTTTATHCLLCAPSLLKVVSSNACEAACPATTYQSGTTCIDCDPTCNGCSGSPTHCTACAVGKYNDTVSATCMAACPVNTFSTGLVCFPCDSSCDGCTTNSTNCDTCKASFKRETATNRCVSACSSTTFLSGSNCDPCDSSCYGCTVNSTNCALCAPGYLRVVTSNQCASSCPSTTFSSGATCVDCDASCLTCSINATHCLSCAASYKNDTSTATCVNPCPSTTYTSGSTCIPCDVSCVGCTVNATNCAACTATYLRVTATNRCVLACPNQTYVSGSSCQACAANCSSCITTASTCLTCAASYYRDANTDACLSTCLAGTFLSGSFCVPCHLSCNGCTLNATHCSACAANYLNDLTTGLCVQTCPANSYATATSCVGCDVSCVGCATSSVLCKVCAGSYFNDTTSGTCPALCPATTYTASNTCYACDVSCVGCTGSAKNCVACASSYLTETVSSTCVLACPAKTYQSATSCLPCDPPCGTCLTSAANCLTCATGYLRDVPTNDCVQLCPNTTYATPTSCIACDATCWGCTTSATNCIACPALYYRTLNANTCTQDCGAGNYANSANMLCTACPTGCALCAKNTAVDCSECKAVSGINYYLSATSCITSCAAGEFGGLNAGKPQCLACTAPCATCSSSATTCLSCNSGNYLKYGTNSCQSGSCPTGQYYATGTLICLLCDANCYECSAAAANCTSCTLNSNGLKSYLHTDKKCYVTCPSGYYGATDGTCTACDASCSGCSGSATNCNACAANYFRAIGSNACTQDCGAGYYGDTSSKLCTVCPVGCVACSIVSTVLTCTECKSVAGISYYLDGSSCLAYCPSGKFGGLDGSSKPVCSGCTSPCATCSTSATTCLTCVSGKNLLYGGTSCATNCDAGTYLPSGTQLCQPCATNCATCSTSASACDSCGLSPYGVTLSLHSSSCLTTCPVQFYPNTANKQCAGCDSSCYTCVGPNANNCTSCNSGSFYPPNATCITACPTGQFSLSSVCYNCAASCSSCQNSSYCTACQAVTGTNYYLTASNVCSVTCPAGTFPNAATANCDACTSPCATCTNSATTCLTCVASNYYAASDNSCSATGCPSGQYHAASSFLCLPCDPNCYTCATVATNCTACTLNGNGITLYLHSDKKCYLNCPAGYYGASNACSACDTSCNGCSGSATNCAFCANSYFRVIGSNACTQSCGTGYYGNTDTQLCTLCPVGCAACAIVSTVLTCSECKSVAGVPYYLDSGSCLVNCPSGKFGGLDGSSKPVCSACTSPCATCSSSATTCLTCVASNYLLLGTNTCSTACDAGTFYPSGSQKCQACSSLCATCQTTFDHCLSCTSIGGVGYFLENNACTVDCSVGNYGSVTTFACTACANGCNDCFGGLVSQCTSCKPYASNNYYLIYGTSYCSQTCPDGQFANATSAACLLCDASCKTCTTSSSNCLTCGFSQLGSNLFFYSNQCLLTCPNGYYPNLSTHTCDSCSEGCAACTATGTSACSVCKAHTNGTNYYKQIGATVCAATCPDGQFISASILYQCQPCSPVCVTCSIEAENCTSSNCSANYYFLNNSCLAFCPDYYYADPTVRQCLTCTAGCQTCFGSGLSSCTKCTTLANGTQYYLQIGLTQCGGTCNSGEYPNTVSKQCTFCNPACATCTTASTCQSCQSVNGIAYFLNSNACTVSCPTGQFGNINNMQCTTCATGCATCFGSTVSDCTSCKLATNNYYLIYGTNYCSQTCPDGQYSNATSFTCLLCASSCKTCVTSSTNCLTCGFSQLGTDLFFYSNQCLLTCPYGYFANVATHTCDQCTDGCAACTALGLTACSVCTISTGSVKYYKHIGATTCATTCPDGQFISASINYLCQPCSPVCVTCSLGAQNCTSSNCTANFFFLNNSCLSACPDNYYADSSLRQCLSCTAGCQSCFASGLSSCTKCNALANGTQYYLQIGLTQCGGTCNSGEFPYSLTKQCVLCNPACSTCTSATTCQSCQSVNGIAYFLSGTSCIVGCPISQYGNSNTQTCDSCFVGCKTCFGPTQDECTSCKTYTGNSTTYYLIYGTTSCSDTCPAGQYKNATSFLCLLCSSNCKTCDIAATNCTSCGSFTAGITLFLENNACKQTCAVGYYRNTANLQCQACLAACVSCEDLTLLSCGSCKSVTVSTTTTVYYKYIGDTICGTSCPLGQFIDSNYANQCRPCDSNCVGCVVTSTNCTQDTGCKVNNFYNNATNSCVTICPDGTFPNVVTKFCEFCTAGCTLCYGSGLSKCTKCDGLSGTNYFKLISLDHCVTTCNSDEFGNTTTYMCNKCNSACATCTSSVACQSCQSVNGIAYFLSSTACIAKCPNGEYGELSNFQCTTCATGCETCFGSAVSDCTSCKLATNNYYLIYGTNYCSQTCPDGQYSNATSFTCLLCASSCKTCVTSSTNCLTCGFSQLGTDLFFYSNQCLLTCPYGYFANVATHTCDQCTDGCAGCYALGLTSCSVCKTTAASVIHYKFIGADTCGTVCPDGQFISSAIPHVCQKCSSVCVTCSSYAENCTSSNCTANFFFLNNSCLSACPDNYYADSSLRQCLSCTSGCQTCFASGLSSCTKCNALANGTQYYLQIGLNQCGGTCNSGEFANSLTKQCTYCNPVCSTCVTSANNCQSCQSVNGIAYYLSGSSCIVTCPSHQFGDLSTFQCTACAAGCNECFGSAVSSCLSCRADVSTNYYLIYGTTYCSQTCPDGQYANATSFTCLLCASSCKTCTSTSVNCLTCGFSQLGSDLFFFANQCLLTCPYGYFANLPTHTCDPCTSGCAACTASGLTACSVCTNDTTPQTYYKHIGATTCGTTCPNGQFISSSILYLCQPCSPLCVTCSLSAENCTSAYCSANYYFLNNSCLAVCPDNYYPDSTLRQCLSCTPGCQTCFGAGLLSCTKCNALANGTQFYLKIGLTECSGLCNSGEFANSVTKQCAPCNPVCSTCVTSANNCQSCQSVNGIAYYLSGSSCIVGCPLHEFGHLASFTCLACAIGCDTCFGSTVNTCYTCTAGLVSTVMTNFYLIYSSSTCSQTCPNGQYSNSTSYKCLLCDVNCLTCSGTSTTCLTCGFSSIGADLFLYGTSCLLTCPVGYFANKATSTCDPCHDGCSVCLGATLSDCSKCSTVNNSGTLTPYYKQVSASICGTSCPTGQFISSSVNNSCAYCDPGCIACSISSANCTINACSSGFFYFALNSSCIPTCPSNYYANLATGLCTQCTAGCQLCYGGGLTACRECQITLTNVSYFKIIDINTCTTVCPPGQYPNVLTLNCNRCSDPCLTCNTSAVDCQTCNNVTGTPYFNLNNQCLLKCPNGYYGEVSNNTCVLCFVGCALCTGPTNTSCSQCRDDVGNSLSYLLVYGSLNCSLACPDGQFASNYANSCFLCDINCLTCLGSASNCTTCSRTGTGILLFLESNICVQSCSKSMYQNGTNHTCLACNLGCAVCTGPALTDCQECRNATDPANASNTLYFYLHQGNSICDTACPTGQFILNGFPNRCQLCSTQCIGCAVTPANCTELHLCAVGFYFYRPTNSCLAACPGGYYANITTKYCEVCAGGCALCSTGDLLSCKQCRRDTVGLVNYYKEIYQDSCVLDCLPGEFEVASDFSCQPCHASCVLCNSTSTHCTQCRNVSGVLYYYYNFECVLNCPNGYYGEKTNNTCVLCHPACALCYGPATDQCYTCRPDATTLPPTAFYLSYGTNYCTTICPYGQYANDTSSACLPCNINCATCVTNSTNCLTCTYVNTINIVYLHNAKCIITCPGGFWHNSTAPLDHRCSPCHPYCTLCNGPLNTDCASCGNESAPATALYYKDLYSTTCNPTCPKGQYIDAIIPNICVPCSTKCLSCATNSSNCFQCDFAYFLYVPNNTCTANCPLNYYNDPTMTPNYYYCTKCTAGCLACNGPTLTNCQSCQNLTLPNTTVVSYFKDTTGPYCVLRCSAGYYGNALNNNCDPCQVGCVSCDDNASYCYSCRSAGGNDYYKPVGSNSCVLVCPNGYYGNSTDYACHACIYFSLNGNCIMTCPANTYAKIINSKAVCHDCNAPDATGNPCNRSYSFDVQTQVSNGGQSLEHKILLPSSLSANVTEEQLKKNLAVYINSPSRRRLLAVNTPLVIEGLTISADRKVIYITTNFQTVDFSSSNVVVNFEAGVLVSSDGTIYQSTTGSFAMSSPIFSQSFYNVFSKQVSSGAEGMIFILLSIILLVFQLVIANRKGYHEILAFIMTLQVLGITRIREYPIDYDVFSVLVGYSYFELSFIPNGFSYIFPSYYTELGASPVVFALGNHNLILNLGSIIQVYAFLQICIGIYYFIKYDKPEHLARLKLYQQTLVVLFMVITLYLSALSMMSLQYNNILSLNTQFLGSVAMALLLLIFYIVYMGVWVRPYRLFQLYKINNLFRIIGLAVLPVNRYGGIIVFDLIELVFIIIDLVLYRHEKLNVKTYAVERILILMAVNASVFSPNATSLLIVAGLSMAIIFGIKIYYTVITVKEYVDMRRLQGASEIDVSDVVNASLKDKEEDDMKMDLGSKDRFNEKLNDSENFIYNEAFDISRLEEQPTKNEILRMDLPNGSEEEQEEEEKKMDHIDQQSSEQSGEELIVYLDPEDYKEEARRAAQRKVAEKSKPSEFIRPTTQGQGIRDTRRARKMDGMRTAANFYPRARGPRNHEIIEQDVEVIKVEPNKSEIDENSDIVSDSSDGVGWLDQNDERNIKRAQLNKTVWKIMDELEPANKKP